MAKKLEFCKISDPNPLLEILKSRHPNSSFMYNQVITHKAFGESLRFYSVGPELNQNTWIFSENLRQDYGSYFCISAPSAIINGTEKISAEIKEIFASSPEVINWNESSIFVSLEKPVSAMIMDISINLKGNITEAHPCNFYYTEIEEALKLQISYPSDAEVRKLNVDNQEEEFIANTWKYTKPGSDQVFRQCILANPSSGVFVEGKCVAGVVMPGYGLISSLYTLQEHRNKRYGRVAMQFLFQECARQGCVPAFSVETRNTRSIKFNEGLGVKLVSVVDWVDVKKFEI